MAHFPKTHASVRAPRTSYSNPEPASFRVADKVIKGGLQRISVTGGCAVLSTTVNGGTLAEIAIQTTYGPVCGLIEFLPGRGARGSELPFRFLAFNDTDYERLSDALRKSD